MTTIQLSDGELMKGISFEEQKLHSPFTVYRIDYQNTFVGYVWKPKNYKGPQNEEFFTTENPKLNQSVFQSNATTTAPMGIRWHKTFAEAANSLAKEEFISAI